MSMNAVISIFTVHAISIVLEKQIPNTNVGARKWKKIAFDCTGFVDNIV